MHPSEPSFRPTLLLLCGLLSDATAWADVAERAPSDWDVRIVSFEGCRSLEEMAGRAFVAGPDRFALVGHSMGGRVALEMMRAAPERIDRIGLFNTGAHPPGEHEALSRGRLVQLARDEGMAAVAAAWLPPMLSPSGAADAALVARLRAMVEAQTPDSFTGQTEALLSRRDARPVLATIAVPTLLLSGTLDSWSPVSQHLAMQEQIPHARLVAVEGAGHFTANEKPDAVIEALSAWMTA